MNDFTKKELLLLGGCVFSKYLSSLKDPAISHLRGDLKILKGKIESMIDNYCQPIISKKLKVIKCHHLTKCIPDQWEIKLMDGRQLYLRARWNFLTATISDSPSDDNDDAIEGKEVFTVPYNNYADKCGHAEIRYITRYYLDWSYCDEDSCGVGNCDDFPKEKVINDE